MIWRRRRERWKEWTARNVSPFKVGSCKIQNPQFSIHQFRTRLTMGQTDSRKLVTIFVLLTPSLVTRRAEIAGHIFLYRRLFSLCHELWGYIFNWDETYPARPLAILSNSKLPWTITSRDYVSSTIVTSVSCGNAVSEILNADDVTNNLCSINFAECNLSYWDDRIASVFFEIDFSCSETEYEC